MQKSRCTVLSGWMGDASRFMRPVNVFPLVETIHHCWGWLRQGLVAYYRLPMLQVIRCSNPGLTRAARDYFLYFDGDERFRCAGTDSKCIAQIRSVLRAQQDAWNRGDIDGFMNGYARSASTVFVSEDTVRRGWETVRERYRKKYSDRAKMGTLSFSDIEITSAVL